MFKLNPQSERPDDIIIQGLFSQMTNNDFSYRETEFYQQKQGVAMGKKFSPSLANIYMSLWEAEALQHKKEVIFWKRYIDDIFGIWKGLKSDFLEFLTFCNQLRSNIKLTWEFDPQELSFLDLNISFNKGSFSFSTHFKDTDSKDIINTGSDHPRRSSQHHVYLPYNAGK